MLPGHASSWPSLEPQAGLPGICELRLNQKRRAKKQLPKREKQPLLVPQHPNQVWSADFMSDALHAGNRFRTFNVIDDFNRECLAVEIDTSLTGRRLIRVFERLSMALPKWVITWKRLMMCNALLATSATIRRQGCHMSLHMKSSLAGRYARSRIP